MGLTSKQWKAFSLLAAVVVGLTAMFNLIELNGQIATAILLAIAGFGSGWVANLESETPHRVLK